MDKETAPSPESIATPETTTVLIPTNARPDSLRQAISAARKNIHPDIEIVVLDSTAEAAGSAVHAAYAEVFDSNPNVRVVRPGRVVPPGHARRILAEESQKPFVLFMDDDHEIQPGAFSCMARACRQYDIVSARWIEDNGVRPLCFHYHFAESDSGKAVIKNALHYAADLDSLVIPADDVLATMLCRRSVFRKVGFDENFSFFFELFDFFMACKAQGVRIAVAVDAVFRHNPVPYQAASARQTNDRERDRAYFVEKWKREPFFGTTPDASAARGGIGADLKRVARHIRRKMRWRM